MTGAAAQTGQPQRRGIPPLAGCAISAAVGLAAVACLVAVLQLTLRGDIAFGRGTSNETRLWLIHEDGNESLGLSRSRIRASTAADSRCTETSIHFYLWRSDGDYPPITTCSCPSAQGQVEANGACPP
jgi:hypothetical protein